MVRAGKRVLVTGGAGFIGSRLVRYLVSLGHRVTVYDKLTYAGGEDTLDDLTNDRCLTPGYVEEGRRVRLVVGDVCDPSAVAHIMYQQDWVFHLAAESHNTRAERDPNLFYDTNVGGTDRVISKARRAGVQRILHMSTDEVYGSATNGFFAENDKVWGDSQATSAYSKSKSLADDYAVSMGQAGAPVVVVRTTNNFGPAQHPEKALPRWITNLLGGERIPLWGEGLQVRDWLYVDEHVRGLVYVMEHGQVGQAYNIAANHKPEITNRMAAELLCRLMDLDPAEWIEYTPDPRPNHDFRYALDTAKIEALGWRPEVSLEQQFQATIDWYRENEDWWRVRKAVAEARYRP